MIINKVAETFLPVLDSEEERLRERLSKIEEFKSAMGYLIECFWKREHYQAAYEEGLKEREAWKKKTGNDLWYIGHISWSPRTDEQIEDAYQRTKKLAIELELDLPPLEEIETTGTTTDMFDDYYVSLLECG